MSCPAAARLSLVSRLQPGHDMLAVRAVRWLDSSVCAVSTVNLNLTVRTYYSSTSVSLLFDRGLTGLSVVTLVSVCDRVEN